MSLFHLENLKKAIASGNAIVIAGTGISMAACGGTPTAMWIGLLEDGVRRCADMGGQASQWQPYMLELLETRTLRNLLKVGQEISDILGFPDEKPFRDWVRDTVGSLELVDSRAIKAIASWPVRIATTNYDNLLEAATGREALTWEDEHEAEEWLKAEAEYSGILHLHGYWKQRSSIVLGSDSYKRILDNEHAQFLQRVIAFNSPVIYLGFGSGLDDPNFGGLLEWLGRTIRDYDGYVIVLDSDVEALNRSLQAKCPNVRAVGFGTAFDHLPVFLESLSPVHAQPAATISALPALIGDTAAPPAAALPATPEVFGHDSEIETLVDQILASPHRPAIVLGGPGIGKTTTTIKAASSYRVAEQFGQRRFFVHLDGAESADQLLSSVASELGIQLPNPQPAVIAYLGEAPSLLILDGFETPFEADETNTEQLLAHLLGGAANLHLVVSMRGRQRPPGINWAEPIVVRHLNEEDSKKAFLSVAGQEFATDKHLHDLLDALGGVPLAIHLLAYAAQGQPNLSWLKSEWGRKSTAILRRAGGDRKDADLQSSYELSIQGPRMTDDARSLLSLLALLPDGVAYDDVSMLADRANEAAVTLRRVGLAFDDAGRLRLHAPLREYVHESYAPAEADRDRVAGYFLTLAAQLGEKIGTGQGDNAVTRLAPEANNISSLIASGLRGRDPRAAIESAIGFSKYMRFTGYGSEELPIAAAHRALELNERSLAAKAFLRGGALALRRSKQAVATELYGLARIAFQEAGDVLGEAKATQSQGDVALDASDYDSARELYEEALEIVEREGDAAAAARCIWGLGNIALTQGRLGQAEKRYEEARIVFQKANNLRGQAGCVVFLGEIALEMGKLDLAKRRYEEEAAMFHRIGDALFEANCVWRLADVAVRQHRIEDARRGYEAAESMYRQIGDTGGEAGCLCGFAEILLSTGDASDAQTALNYLHEALKTYQDVKDTRNQAECMLRIGDVASKAGKRVEAQDWYSQALELFDEMGVASWAGRAHQKLSTVAGTDEERSSLASKARDIWLSVDRHDLIAEFLG